MMLSSPHRAMHAERLLAAGPAGGGALQSSPAAPRLGRRHHTLRDDRSGRSRSSNGSFSLVVHDSSQICPSSVYWTTSSGSDDGSCCGNNGSVAGAPPTTTAAEGGHLLPDALALVAGFLDRQGLDAFRCSNSLWCAAADAVAPRPFAASQQQHVLRTPQPSPTFLRWPAAIDPVGAPKSAPQPVPHRGVGATAAAKRSASPWACLACGKLSAHEARNCQHCHALMAKCSCRVFVGQLAKRRTAALLSQVVAFVAPTVRVLRIEPHTNGDTAVTGETRGCAWVYLRDVSDAIRLMHGLHRRAFFDVDADERGGTWLAPQGSTVAVLHSFAQNRNEHPARSALPWLPPSPVKVEMPAGSLLLTRAAAFQAEAALRVAPHLHVGGAPAAARLLPPAPPRHNQQHYPVAPTYHHHPSNLSATLIPTSTAPLGVHPHEHAGSHTARNPLPPAVLRLPVSVPY